MDRLLTLLVVEVGVGAISSSVASGAILGHCLLHGGPDWCYAAGAHELPLASVFEVGTAHWSWKLFDQHDNLEGGHGVQY